MIDASALIGFSMAPPKTPEWTSWKGPRTWISAAARPRRPTVIAGTFPAKKPESATSATLAVSRAALAVSHGSRWTELDSSSPSKTKRRLTGSAPWVARIASAAKRAMQTFDLSSDAPRARMRPSRTIGSNGAACHSSRGSTGWTS